jgi:spermidine synthase
MSRPTTAGRGLLLPLFFLSGASGLILESVWQRMMILVFGASAPATAIILAAVFLGLALGSRLGASWLRRGVSPGRIYALAELWVGAAALAVPPLLRVADGLQPALDGNVAAGGAGAFGVRLVLALGAVLPATIGMGATIPAMSRLLAGDRGRVGAGVALAYGSNTLGAMLGCLGTGFVFIQHFGTTATLRGAVLLNLTVGLVALAALWRRPADFPTVAGVEPDPGSGPAVRHPPAHNRSLLAALYFASSFVALGAEVVWMRLLGLYNTNSVTTFTVTLTVYLAATALGSLLLYPWLARRLDSAAVYAVAMLGAGGATLLGGLAFGFMPRLNQLFITIPANANRLGLGTVVTVEAAYALAVMFLPVLALGVAFPAACQAAAGPDGEAGATSGRLYALGNLASALGVLVVGLWLVPALGLVATLGGLALLAGGTGLAALRLLRPAMGAGMRHGLLGAGLAVLAGAVAFAIFIPPPFRLGRLEREGTGWRVAYPGDSSAAPPAVRLQRDGPSATVTVLEPAESTAADPIRRIYVDGQLVASSDPGSRVDSKMLAHLPLLLHPRPRRALTVGFGSGGTSWSMALHGIRVDCVEIEPEVPRAAGWFEFQNHGVTGRDNFHLILDDARHYLHLTTARYDVIATDVTNLQYKQNGYLYTTDYFALMKARLAAGGIACAWVPMAAVTPAEYRSLLQSFAAVYPHASVWFLNCTETNFAVFVGTEGALRIDLARLAEGFADPGIRADLAGIGVTHPYQFAHFLHLDEDGVRRFTGAAPVHTDDRPILEFTSPLSFYQKTPTFVVNLGETIRQQSKSLAGLVTGPLDAALFERYRANSELRTRMILALSLTRLPLPDAELRQQLEVAVQYARQSLALFPEDPLGTVLLRYFSARLRELTLRP